MLFLINMFNINKPSQGLAEDPMRILEHQLMALGHQVEYSNKEFVLQDEGINIVAEFFTPTITAEIAAAKNDGARFIFLGTEEPTPKGWNYGLITQASDRQNEFPNAAKYCDGVLYFIPGQHVHNWYNQWAPSAFVDLGYAPTLIRQQDIEPTVDFGFFGSLTRRRFEILERLRKYSGSEIVIECMFPSAAERDETMRHARVMLQIRKDDEMGYVSSMRCNTAMCLGRPVLAEPHALADQSPWSKIVKFSKSNEAFFQDAIKMRRDWRDAYSRQFEKFKNLLTPQFCVGRALEEIKLDLSLQVLKNVQQCTT